MAIALKKDKTSPKRIDDLKRRQEAFALRKGGANYHQIAKQLGFNSPQSAHQYVMEAIKELNETLQEEIAQVRRMELERLDGMQVPFMLAAKTGSPEAAGVVLRIQDMRARLLGLFAPTKIDASVKPVGSFFDLIRMKASERNGVVNRD